MSEPTVDAEIEAARTLVNAFENLTDEQRRRVLAWASDRWGTPSTLVIRQTPATAELAFLYQQLTGWTAEHGDPRE